MKNILIYPHDKFSLSDGGIVVQYYLGYILNSLKVNVEIYNIYDNNSKNIIYNNFVEDINNINFDNTIVIYCEGIIGNPLNAKYVVRWMLSKLGDNVPHKNYYSWGHNELVYFFNNEIDMINKNIHKKLLSLFYINPKIKAYNFKKRGICYTMRKNQTYMNKNEIDLRQFKGLPRFEITKQHQQDDYINIFNNHEYFVSYDCLTFLNIIAALCGCISIIYPVDNIITKQEYFKMTPFYDYMIEKNINEIYGLAYGFSDDEINYSKNTLHLVKEQMIDVQNWLINNSVKNFIVDMNNLNLNNNNLVYYKNSMLVVDVNFYKKIYNDLKLMTDEELLQHFHEHGKNEGRLSNEKDFYDLYPTFDIDFYKNFYDDLNWMTREELLQHFYNHGITENRLLNESTFHNLYPNFDIEFYRSFYTDLSWMSDKELLNHYHHNGIIEGRIICENDFDVEYYKSFNSQLKDMKNKEIIISYLDIINTIKQTQNSNLEEFKILQHVKIINNKATMKIQNKLTGLEHWNKISQFNYNNLYLSWFHDCINTRKISIVSPINNEIIYTDKYFITNNLDNENTKYSVCNYYFENEQIILGLGLGTGNHPQDAHILYIYCIKENNILYEWYNYPIEEFKNKLFIKILFTFNNVVKNSNFEIIDNKITTIYGYMNNMAHQLFNDYTGLYLLHYSKIIGNIDEVFLGSHDVFYIENFFQEFQNINIINNDDISKNEIVGKGVVFKYNHNFILDDTISFLNNNLIMGVTNNNYKNYDYEYEKNSAELIKKTHYPIFNIVLRKGSFEMVNQETTIANLINLLVDKYPNAFFYLDGFVSNSNNKNVFIEIENKVKIHDICNSYLELSNKIIENINTQNYKSLINTNILNLITHIQNCNYGIYILGSAACNSAWICKIPGIQFGRPHIKLYEHMDKLIRENNPDIIYFDDCNKISYNEDNSFNIEAKTIFDLIPKF